MKRFLVLLFVILCNLCAIAQVYLPCTNNFDNATILTDGWIWDVDDPNALDAMMGGIQTPYDSHDIYSAPNVWVFSSFMGDNVYQRLISPRFVANGTDSVKITFQYHVGDANNTETLRIGYCTSDSYESIADFQWASQTLTTNSYDWQTFSVTLSPATQYIVLDYLSLQQYFLAIDDIVIEEVTGLGVFPITVSYSGGGIVSPGSCTVNQGDDITFNMIPDEGHWVENVWVDNFRVGNVDSYTFENVNAAHTLNARFRPIDYEMHIVISGDGVGTVTPEPQILDLLLVPWDTTINFVFTPDPGSYLFDVIVDDTLHLGVVYGYTFENIRENHKIEVVFTLESYTVQASSGPNGMISPRGTTSYHYDDSQLFTITADPGYWIDALYVDGVIVDSAAHQTSFVYLMDSIRDNHTIGVMFSRIQCTITVNASNGGTYAVTGATSTSPNTYVAYYGSNITITTTPSTGFYTSSLELNNEAQPNVSRCVISSIAIDYNVVIAFSMQQFSITVNHNELGTVTPTEANNINYFDSAYFSISYPSCSMLDSVTLDGQLLPTQMEYAFSELAGSHVLDVYFNDVYYTCQLSSDETGMILGEENPLCGSSEMYLILPEPCYQLDAFYVDNVESTSQIQDMDGNPVFFLNDIQNDHVLRAEFQQITYSVNVASPTGNGTWIANNEILCDSTFDIAVVADSCYAIDVVDIDGEVYDIKAGTLPPTAYFRNDTLYFSLEMVEEDYQIELSFGPSILQTYMADVDNGMILELFDTLYCGSTGSWLIVPAACYSISGVYVNEVDYTSQLQIDEYGMSLEVANLRENTTIRAEFARTDMRVIYSAGEHGSVAASVESTAACGDDVTFTIVPDDCYQVDSVFLNGVSINDALAYNACITSSHTGDTAFYTLQNIVRDCALTATFAPLQYQIQTSVNGEGTITYSLADNVISCGDSISYTITPAACNAVSSISLNGTAVANYDLNDGIASFSVAQVFENQEVTADFEVISYALSSEFADHGTIAVATEVSCGDTTLVTLTPDACYFVDSVWVDGVAVSFEDWSTDGAGVVTFPLNNITTSHNVSAKFSRIMYPVHVTCNLPMEIVHADTLIACGDNAEFQFVTDACYQLDSVIANGFVYTFADLLQARYVNRLGGVLYFTFPQILEATNYSIMMHQITYPLNVTYNQDGGQVTYPNITEIACGDDCHFQMTPVDCYEIANVLLNGTSIMSQLTWNGNEASYDIVNCGRAANLVVTFAQKTHPVNVAWIAGTDTLNAYAVTANCGDTVSFVAAWPDDCYVIDTAFANGIGITLDSLYVIPDIHENMNIEIQMHKLIYRITVAELSGGAQLDPFGRNEIECGDDFTVTFIPSVNYDLQNWVVDGDTVAPSSTYTFENVHADHTLSAVLEGVGYHIHAQAGDGGLISPSDAYTAPGDTVTFNIMPDDCFVVDSVWVDGNYVGNMTSYTFEDIAADHTLAATFRQLSYNMTLAAGQHGYISLSGSPSVLCGDSRVVTISPSQCYQVQSFYINNVESSDQLSSLTSTSTLTFDDIAMNYNIYVTFATIVYDVTTSSNDGGTVSVSESQVNCGDDATVTIAPDDCHYIDSILVNGEYVGNEPSLQISNIQENKYVQVLFAIRQYQFVANNAVGGTIYPADTTMANCGDTLQYSFVPDEGYHLSAVLIDNVTFGATDTYTFRNINGSHSVGALFDRNVYTVTVEVVGNGTVTPATINSVLHGDSLALAFIAAACSDVDSVIVDGNFVGAVTNLTLQNITQNQSVRVVFVERTYTVNASATAGGTITPSGVNVVACGNAIAFTMAPDYGYHQTGIVVDNDTLPAATSYNFSDVQENHTIEALFEQNTYFVVVDVTGAGSSSVTDTVEVTHGDNLDLMFTPEDCHQVDTILVNGAFVGNSTNYTLTNITENMTVNVVFSVIEYSVNITTTTGGSATQTGNVAVACGDDLNVTFSADDCYHLDSVWVDGVFVGNVPLCSLTNIAENHTIAASFAADYYTITTAVTMNNVEVSRTSFEIMCGSDTLVEFPMVACYGVGTLLVNGVSETPADDYYLSDIRQNYLLEVELTEQMYVVVAEVQGEGTVTPADTTLVACGENVDYTFTPAEGWHLSDVLVDGESVEGAGDNFTLQNVSANHTITAVFARDEYIIISNIDPINAGNITPYGATTVQGGEDITYTIFAFPAYEIREVVVDGVGVGAVTSYTFENVNDNHTIEAFLNGVGIVDNELESILHVYAQNQSIYIENTTNQIVNGISIFDMDGKLVYRTNDLMGSAVIPMNVPTGIYLLRVQFNGVVLTYKVQLNRF